MTQPSTMTSETYNEPGWMDSLFQYRSEEYEKIKDKFFFFLKNQKKLPLTVSLKKHQVWSLFFYERPYPTLKLFIH